MTHLSDFSYLQRCVLEVYITGFLLMRVWANDRFKCLHPKRIIAGELRGIITYLYIFMLLGQASWDIISTYIKYTESYFLNPLNGDIISKPFHFWSEEHKALALAFDYVQSVNLSLQTGVFFLLQCFWNYLSNTVAKRTFMSSWEFKFYIFWAIASVAIFPILQYSFRKDEGRREVVPQMTYAVGVIVTCLLGVRSDRRFNRLLNISRNIKHGGAQIVEKLAYFKDMNLYFTVILLFYGIAYLILCIDALTPSKTINTHKFAADALVAICNMSAILMWVVGISIFHPRRSENDITASLGSRSKGTSKDEEIEMPSNKEFIKNGSSSDGVVNNVNTRRLSQRITNFIANKGAGNAPYGEKNQHGYGHEDHSSVYTPNGNSHQASYMRPMSPVQPDYSANEKLHFSKPSNLAVDDPYTSKPISYTTDAASSANNSKYISVASPTLSPTYASYEDSFRRTQSPSSMNNSSMRQQEYSMQNISATRGSDDYRFDGMAEKDEYDYLGKPTGKSGGMTQDWLRQSPDKRI